MAKTIVSQGLIKIPAFADALNRVGERAGFKVTVTTGKFYSNADYESIISKWEGSKRAFLNLAFLPDSLRNRIFSKSGVIAWPGENWRYPAIFLAGFEVAGSKVSLEVCGGPVPNKNGKKGAVSFSEYEDRTVFFGTREQLIAEKICVEKQFPGKKTIRSNRDPYGYAFPGNMWHTRRYPDGCFAHTIESDAAKAERLKAAAEQEKERKRAQEKHRSEQEENTCLLGQLESHLLGSARARLTPAGNMEAWSKRLSACCELLTKVESEFLAGKSKYQEFAISPECDRAMDDISVARTSLSALASEMNGSGLDLEDGKE